MVPSISEGFSVIMVTSTTTKNVVSIDALRELRNLGLCQLVSPASSSAILFPSPSHLQSPKNDEESRNKDSDNEDSEEELLPKHCPREYPSMKFHPISFYH